MAIGSQLFTGLTLPVSPPSSSTSATALCTVERSLKTSLFNGGVGAFKVSRIKLAPSNLSIRSRQRGNALVTRMSLFDRFARVAKVLASQKRLENKYKAAQQTSEEWYRKAQFALGKGDEDLAREALKRRKSYADNASSLKAQFEQQKIVVDNLVSNTRKLESKIQEARSKKDTLKARAQSAKTATKVNEMLGNVNTSSALSAFEKMEEKVMAMESQAEALGQLTTDDLEGKFALLESSSVDDDLANLKKELSGSFKKGELPAGNTAVPSGNKAFPFRDAQIEKELNDLRQKSKDL
ncbi:hypothetical protein RHGRI_025459 [Rhododendron griersonianum]|uniref:Uncharacterized protein n=1 Tax=Rhododendron griersonianum TaxID=479676 RepID=A0AAV6ITT8_9ERIC|nr:hypothetical protein RHGRI_025459 [Rhododendron griersonianum]